LGEDLALLQENLEMFTETFDEDAKEYGHRAYKDGPKRKKTKTDLCPDPSTLDAVRRSDWMKDKVKEILALRG
jgi:hypothetical protein